MATEIIAPLYQTETGGSPLTGRREALRVAGLSKWFDRERVLNDISFSIAEGESLVLLGPSGSGKSTTLRVIAGLEQPDAGDIFLRGRHIEHLRARERNVGVIFQQYALFPRMSVAENIGFGLRIRRIGRRERKKVVDDLLEMIGLNDQRDKYPSQISGGQQQRVAIARALAYKPEVLLFDESFSALDPQTRVSLRREIRTLLRRLNVPALFITHDQEEAMEMGDQIAILNEGRLEQVGTPSEVYNHPQTEFVATFLGAANVVEADLVDGWIRLDWGRYLYPSELPPSVIEQRFKLVFRPEDIILGKPADHLDTPHFLGIGEVIDTTFAGSHEALTLRIKPEANPAAPARTEAVPNGEFLIKVLRTKWESVDLKLASGSPVSIGLKSFKPLWAFEGNGIESRSEDQRAS